MHTEKAVILLVFISSYPSPVGELLLAAREDALTGLWLEGQKYFPRGLPERAVREEHHPVLLQTKDWLNRYFSGAKPNPGELNLSPDGSEFRRQVWDLLLQIPYGQVTTYGALARELAYQRGVSSLSAQAVGGAVGHNPISIIIPCHRVVGADGSLTGYAGGLDRKIRLLTLEGTYRPTIEIT